MEITDIYTNSIDNNYYVFMVLPVLYRTKNIRVAMKVSLLTGKYLHSKDNDLSGWMEGR